MSQTKLTPSTREGIASRLAAGAPLTDAARAEGVHPQTAKGWLTRGRKESAGTYHEFAKAVEAARQRAAERPEPVDAEEFRRRLDESVRAGSVSALTLWARLYLDPERESEQPSSVIAQLSERRKRRESS